MVSVDQQTNTTLPERLAQGIKENEAAIVAKALIELALRQPPATALTMLQEAFALLSDAKITETDSAFHLMSEGAAENSAPLKIEKTPLQALEEFMEPYLTEAENLEGRPGEKAVNTFQVLKSNLRSNRERDLIKLEEFYALVHNYRPVAQEALTPLLNEAFSLISAIRLGMNIEKKRMADQLANEWATTPGASNF